MRRLDGRTAIVTGGAAVPQQPAVDVRLVEGGDPAPDRAGGGRTPELQGMEPRQVFLTLVGQQVPLGVEQTPEQMGRLAVFLASDDAATITGQAISSTAGSRSVRRWCGAPAALGRAAQTGGGPRSLPEPSAALAAAASGCRGQHQGG